MKAVILANGHFPTKKELLEELQMAPFLIVCDGAAQYIEAIGKSPDVIIGDLDSITPGLRQQYQNKLVHIKEQESNDLSKAFYHALSLGYDEFSILGATGLREDHSIANVGLLFDYAKKTQQIALKSDDGEFRIYQTPCEIPSFQGQQISLFSPHPEIKWTSCNLRYELCDLQLSLWGSGTLNEALGDAFFLKSDPVSVVLVYTPYG